LDPDVPNDGDSFILKLIKRMVKVFESRGESAVLLNAVQYITPFLKPITDLAVAENYSIELKQIINDFKAKHPDLKDSEIKSMDSLVCFLSFSAIHKIVTTNKILLEKVNFKLFTDLLNNLDGDEFIFCHITMLNAYFGELLSSRHFRSAHVLWNCWKSNHEATKAGKNRMKLKKDDFDHYLIVQDFELKFKKFQYLDALVLAKSPEPSAFDLKTAEILKGLKDYRPEFNELPSELKTFEEVKAAGDFIFETLENLSAYDSYMESWKKWETFREGLMYSASELPIAESPSIKFQIFASLAQYTEDNFKKCELVEKALSYEKEMRKSSSDKFETEMEITQVWLNFIIYRVHALSSDQSNKECENKLKETLKDGMTVVYEYFRWVNDLIETGHELSKNHVERIFAYLLMANFINEGIYKDPQIMEFYSGQIECWLKKYSYLEEAYQKNREKESHVFGNAATGDAEGSGEKVEEIEVKTKEELNGVGEKPDDQKKAGGGDD
jgi:hypothetical protein